MQQRIFPDAATMDQGVAAYALQSASTPGRVVQVVPRMSPIWPHLVSAIEAKM